MNTNKLKIDKENNKEKPSLGTNIWFKKKAKQVADLLSGRAFRKDQFFNHLPFLIFLSVLLILYISKGYYTEKIIKKIQRVNKEVRELRSEYITIKSELNFKSQQSQVASKARQIGLKESLSPPVKIFVSKKQLKSISQNND